MFIQGRLNLFHDSGRVRVFNEYFAIYYFVFSESAQTGCSLNRHPHGRDSDTVGYKNA